LVDDTGEIRLCLWNDKADIAKTMKRGDIILIENGYTKMGLNGLELHSGWRGRGLQNCDIEIQPLPELERVSLIDLTPGNSYDVSGTVTEISEKRSFVRSDGSPGQLARFLLQDESAEICVVLWNEKADLIDNLVKGVPMLIDNGFAKEGMEGLELHVSSLGQVLLHEQFTPETKAFNIEKGPVTVVGRYHQGALVDESGRIPLASDDSIADGQLLRVKGHFDTEIAPDEIEEITEEFPSLESLLRPPRKALSDVKEGDYVEVYALVKRVCDFGAYKRIKIDDSTAEVTGIVFGDMTDGEEYCFYARIFKRTAGMEFICYQYHSVEAEEEAFDMIREIEGLMEV